MRNILIIASIVLLCACSSSPSIPQWKDTAFRQLENYKENFLTDKEDLTEPHFAKTKKAASDGNDLDKLGTIYLTKYALHVASLEDFDGSEFLKIDKLQPNAVHEAYYHFLKGHFSLINTKHLPSNYSKFLSAMVKNDYSTANREIVSLENPLSCLIACGIRIKYSPGDENILYLAIDTAARQGWRRPLWAYLNRLHKFYIDHQQIDKANHIKERLDILKK